MPEYLWDPLTPAEVANVLDPVGIDWWIAGGVAIDLFVGHETRRHGDLDTAILRRDVAPLASLLPAWDINIAHDGKLTPWHGAPLPPEVHQFWSRSRGAETWAFEILLEHTDGSDWIYRRDERIRRPISSIALRSPNDIPYLAPEICLLYKSPYMNALPAQAERNAADFNTAAPLLDDRSRAWLCDAMLIISPGHPWIARLESLPSR